MPGRRSRVVEGRQALRLLVDFPAHRPGRSSNGSGTTWPSVYRQVRPPGRRPGRSVRTAACGCGRPSPGVPPAGSGRGWRARAGARRRRWTGTGRAPGCPPPGGGARQVEQLAAVRIPEPAQRHPLQYGAGLADRPARVPGDALRRHRPEPAQAAGDQQLLGRLERDRAGQPATGQPVHVRPREGTIVPPVSAAVPAGLCPGPPRVAPHDAASRAPGPASRGPRARESRSCCIRVTAHLRGEQRRYNAQARRALHVCTSRALSRTAASLAVPPAVASRAAI